MDSPKKASKKYQEFNINRDKARIKELETKCQDYQVQFSNLEQEKAELRRDKFALGEELKKAQKLEERVHALQKELDTKESLLCEERAKRQEAEASKTSLTQNAHATIETWKSAEREWLAETNLLKSINNDYATQKASLEENMRLLSSTNQEIERSLRLEKERANKQYDRCEILEKEIQTLNEKNEKLQNTNFGLEQKVYLLDQAGDKQREAVLLKDTEIKSLEEKIAKHIQNEEKLDQTINNLNDRINAAKMTNLEGKGENEKLACDVSEARKETQRLTMQIDSLKREQLLAQRHEENLQHIIDELKEKCHSQQESLKEKNVEIRKRELSESQLTVEYKKIENERDELSFKYSSLEVTVQNLHEGIKRHQETASDLHEECRLYKEECKALNHKLEERGEDTVMLKSKYEDTIESLQKDICSLESEALSRQEIIRDLTVQLGNTNEKNAAYHNKILEESEMGAKTRQEMERRSSQINQLRRELYCAQCLGNKTSIEAEYWEGISELYSEMFNFAHTRSSELSETNNSLLSSLNITKGDLLTLEEMKQKLEQNILTQETELSSIKDLMVSKDNTISDLEEKLGQTNESLQESQKRTTELALSLQSLQERSVDASQSVSVYNLTIERIYCFHEAASLIFNELEAMKFTIFLEAVQSFMAQMKEEKTILETRYKDAIKYSDEVKACCAKQEASYAQSTENLQIRISTLEAQLQFTKKDSEQIKFQLDTLLNRFESEQVLMRAEVAKRERCEKDMAKLRKGLEYELARKIEYKNALCEAKKLRAEVDENREKEKSMAKEAIAQYIQEITYWVSTFDTLKKTVDSCLISGSKFPPIDPTVESRLSSAKRKYLTSLRQQDVNCEVGTKRRRVDFNCNE